MSDHVISSNSQVSIADRIRGAILGAACGNALGGSSLGMSHKDILATVGSSGLRDFAPGLSRSLNPMYQAGSLLADSQLTLSIGESLADNKGAFNKADLVKRFENLLENKEFADSNPGVACLAGIRSFVDGTEPSKNQPEPLSASGCVANFIFGCLNQAGAEDNHAAQLAAQLAASMFVDKRMQAASAILADSIHYFISGKRLDSGSEVRDFVKRELNLAQPIDERFAEAWDDVAPDLDYEHPACALPYSLVNVESTVAELVPTAVGIFLIFRHDPEEAICWAARAGGDTGTVSLVVGALAGSYHGASKLPQRWLASIASHDRLEAVAQALAKHWA